jgi:hypothetical protein
MNIADIASSELRTDLVDSYRDAEVCRAALKVGVVQYSGGSVANRLKANEEMIALIEAELMRRGESPVVNLTPE